MYPLYRAERSLNSRVISRNGLNFFYLFICLSLLAFFSARAPSFRGVAVFYFCNANGFYSQRNDRCSTIWLYLEVLDV